MASGTGLRGAYYNADPKSAPPSLVRVDPRVESAALRSLPASLSGKPVRWVRWCGWIRPTVTGAYRFRSAAKTMSVRIAQQVVAGPKAAVGASIPLEAGKAYAVLVELPNTDSVGDFTLQWTPPFGVSYDVPPTVLFPPVETVQPGCQA